MFTPDTVPCPAPIALDVPPDYTVGWEKAEGVYRLKLYGLDTNFVLAGDCQTAIIDADSIDGAQQILDEMIRG